MVSRRDLLKSSIATGSILFTGALPEPATASSHTFDHFVERNGSNLTVNGESWYFSGADNFWLTHSYSGTQSRVDARMDDWQELTLNAARIWAFCEGQGGDCFQPQPRTYDEQAFQQLDYLIQQAEQHGVRLVLSLVDNWGFEGGMDKYVEWSSSASSHDDFYTDSECRDMYKDYVNYVLNRTNSFTGVQYKNDPTILTWELANEARCSSDTSGDTLHSWYQDMAAYVKSIDSNHLVSTGMEGWYNSANEGTDFVRDHNIADIDICSIHLYPENWNKTESEAITWIEEHAADAANNIGKPLYCGEFGWRAPDRTDSQMDERNRIYGNWYGEFDAHNYAGALPWHLHGEDKPTNTYSILMSDSGTISEMQDFTDRMHAKSGSTTDSTTFVDDCSDLSNLASGSDTGSLGTDTTNSSYFEHPDGSTDGARIARWETTADTSMVYAPGGEITSLRIEGHYHDSSGGDFVFYESTDAGSTWTQVTPTETTYGGVDTQWHHVEFTYSSFSDGVDQVRIDLVGGNNDWSGQVGHVELGYATTTFVDDCSDLSNLASGSETGSLGTDTTNSSYFERPDGSTDGARIARWETTADTSMVYAPGGEIISLRVEGHYHDSSGGDFVFYESTDAGSTWTQVTPTESSYGGVDSNWHHTEFTHSSFSDGVDQVRIDLVGGNNDWSGQVGHVELEHVE